MPDPPDIDRRELKRLLALKGYPASFDSMKFDLVGRFSTDVWQLQLTGGASHDLPMLIVKNPFQKNRSAESADLEAFLYEEISPDLPVLVPPFIGRIKEVLILEKIPDLEPFDFKPGPGARHAELAMWNRVEEFTWLPQLSNTDLRQSFQADFDRGWQDNRHSLNELCPQFTKTGDALVGRLAATLEQLGTPATLLHGDGHAENLPMTQQGEIVFLDWQAPRAGNAGFDIAVFMAMSYPIESRRMVEEKLVQLHYETIRRSGIHWPEPVRDYSLGLLRRVARIVEISADSWFSSLSWVYKRCAMAAVDHGVADLII